MCLRSGYMSRIGIGRCIRRRAKIFVPMVCVHHAPVFGLHGSLRRNPSKRTIAKCAGIGIRANATRR